MTGIYKAKKCGVQFNPPCVILIYEDTLSCKLRRRSMPVRNFSATSDVVPAAKLIKERHKRYMEPVSQVVVEKMLRLIQLNIKGHNLEISLEKVEKEYEVNPEEDLNKLDTEELERKKAIMDLKFNKSKIRPSDPNFEYDKRVDFNPDKPSDWDNSGDDESDSQDIPILDDNVIAEKYEPKFSTAQAEEKDEQFSELQDSIVEEDEEQEVEDSLEDKDPKLNIQFNVKDLEDELKVDDADDFWN